MKPGPYYIIEEDGSELIASKLAFDALEQNKWSLQHARTFALNDHPWLIVNADKTTGAVGIIARGETPLKAIQNAMEGKK